jgi:hypothetical protein
VADGGAYARNLSQFKASLELVVEMCLSATIGVCLHRVLKPSLQMKSLSFSATEVSSS